MKAFFMTLVMFAGLTLAVSAGRHMRDESMRVMVGITLGVGATVPTTLLLVKLVRRGDRTTHADLLQEPPRQLPQLDATLRSSAYLRSSAPGLILPEEHSVPVRRRPAMLQIERRRVREVGDDDNWS